jgi:endoglucanase
MLEGAIGRVGRVVLSSMNRRGTSVLLRRLHIFYSMCFVLLLSATPVSDAQFVKTKGTEIVDASGKPLLIRGISIGNWMVLEGYFWHFGPNNTYQRDVEAVFEDLLGPTQAQQFLYQWRQNLITKADIDRIKRDGFNTIRVPLHTKYFKTDDDEGFKLVDQLMKWCREDHIYVILMLESGVGGATGEASDDGPAYPWLLKDAGMQGYVNQTWTRIARHYRNERMILGFDLLNEPLLWTGYLNLESLIEPEYRRITEAIRKVDSHHMLILQPARGRFGEFGRPFDSNTVYSYHSYNSTPGPEFLKQYLDFRTKYQVPILFAEVYAERAPKWLIDHVNLAQQNNIGWIIWPYKKMGGKSPGPYTFPAPAHWADIVTFAKQTREDNTVKERNAVRPPQQETEAIFAEMLENEKNDHVIVHPEYLDLPGISAH